MEIPGDFHGISLELRLQLKILPGNQDILRKIRERAKQVNPGKAESSKGSAPGAQQSSQSASQSTGVKIRKQKILSNFQQTLEC